MKCRLRTVTLAAPLLAVLALLFGAAPASAQNMNCDLDAPPTEAVVGRSIHDSQVYLFPAETGAGYSGCQTLWHEEGRLFQLRFAAGEAADLYGYERGREQLLCSFRDGKLTVDNDKSCAAIRPDLSRQGLKMFGDFSS